MKVIDMHCDTICELYKKKQEGKPFSLLDNDCHIDLTRMEKGDYCLQNFALFTNIANHDRPFEYCMELADIFYTELEKYGDRIGIVRSYDDIRQNMKAGRMSAMMTIEEGGVCQGRLEFLRNFYRLGVRMMTLTWNHPNELGWPNISGDQGNVGASEPDTGHGLTEKGIEFVEEMERLGIIADVSHLSDAGFYDVLDHTKKPFVASHSNARAVAGNLRNLTDDMIKKLAERGGVTGINYYGAFLYDWKQGEPMFSRLDDMVRHMKHMKKVGGIEVIGLGSDFDGIWGELEVKSPADLPLLERAMKKSGFTESEIEAVFYKNVLRVYEAVLK